MRSLLIGSLFAVLASPVVAQDTAANRDLRVSRYSTISPTPAEAQAHPLKAVVQLSFPRQQVQTVGDAVNYLLLRTGYRLIASDQMDAKVREVLTLPLPEVHRRIGPYTVETALRLLLGKPFVVSVDLVRRQIAYGLPEAIQEIAQRAAPQSAEVAEIENTRKFEGTDLGAWVESPVARAAAPGRGGERQGLVDSTQ